MRSPPRASALTSLATLNGYVESSFRQLAWLDALVGRRRTSQCGTTGGIHVADSIALCLSTFQVGEALILPSETKLKYVESAIETARQYNVKAVRPRAAYVPPSRYAVSSSGVLQCCDHYHKAADSAANRSLMKRRRPQLRATRLEPRQ